MLSFICHYFDPILSQFVWFFFYSSIFFVLFDFYQHWLSCTKCGRQLSQSRSCYIRNGRIYCKDDNCKLIIKCSKCDRIISSNDWVRRAGLLVYHLACFACDLCQRQLSTGEKFTLEKQQQQQPSSLLSPPNSINSNSSQTTLINNQQQQQQLSYRLVCKLHFGIKEGKDGFVFYFKIMKL